MVVFATGVASPCCNFFDSQVGIKWGDGDDLVCDALDRGIQGAWQSEEFAEFLLKKWRRKPAKKLRQDWAGALKDYRDQYTSLELQRKALAWRGD